MKNKKLLLVLLLAIFLPLLVIAAMQIQDIRNRAAGTNEIAVKLLPQSGNFSPGQNVTIKIALSKLATRPISISGAQAVVNVGGQFAVNSATCDSPFNGLPFTKITGSTVTVMCAVATSGNPVPATASDIPFATLSLTVSNSASGNATIGFTSTRATEAGISGAAPDVSAAGTGGNYTIGGGTGGASPTTTSGGASPTTTSGGASPTVPVSGDVVLSFAPSSVTLPPNTTVKIMANSPTKSVAFARTVFTFDPSKVNLASEITTSSRFSTVVSKTTRAEANQSGKATFVIATSPTDTKPTGMFELASFSLSSLSSQPDITEITFSTSEMQFVDAGSGQLNIGANALNINLNGGGSNVTPGQDFEVPVGTKDQIIVNIGGGSSGNEPKITFTASLNNTQNNPDMYFRLRVKDDLFFVDNPGNLSGSCNAPNSGEKDFYIPMRASGNVYSPVSSISQSPPASGSPAAVSADGWVTLNGITPDRFYTLILKAPKFRGSKVIEHVKLISGQNSANAFDFTGSPLDPGDLPDPNNQFMQDCTVNSIDISLIISRIGSTVPQDTAVADVNFDDIVNGNDISKVVNTLSTKPDDDL